MGFGTSRRDMAGPPHFKLRSSIYECLTGISLIKTFTSSLDKDLNLVSLEPSGLVSTMLLGLGAFASLLLNFFILVSKKLLKLLLRDLAQICVLWQGQLLLSLETGAQDFEHCFGIYLSFVCIYNMKSFSNIISWSLHYSIFFFLVALHLLFSCNLLLTSLSAFSTDNYP